MTERTKFKHALDSMDSNQRTALLYLESLIIEKSKNASTRNEVEHINLELITMRKIVNDVFEYTSTYDQKRMFDTLEKIIIERNQIIQKQVDETKVYIKKDYLAARKHLETQLEEMNKRISFAKSAIDKTMFALQKSGLIPELIQVDQMPREKRRQNKF